MPVGFVTCKGRNFQLSLLIPAEKAKSKFQTFAVRTLEPRTRSLGKVIKAYLLQSY